MKKRVLSLALVVVLLFSLIPFGAFAAGSAATTIITQPTNVTVNPGDDAVFTITAVNTDALSNGGLKYLWYDPDSTAIDTTKLAAVKTAGKCLDSDIANIFGSAKLGDGKTLTFSNVQEEQSGQNVCCVVYYITGTYIKYDTAIVFSNTVSLTVNRVCESHVYGENVYKVEALDATCAHEGNIEYYKCRDCGRCFADEDATTQITSSTYTIAKLTTHVMPLEHVDAVAGTCDSKSVAEYWVCSECGQMFKDAEGTQTTTLLKLKSEGSKNPNNHVNVTHVEAKDATCCDKGNIEYWKCEDCNTYYQDEALTKTCDDDDVVIAKNPNNHTNLVEHAYAEANCTTDGSRAYWECTGCGNYYRDAAGTSKYESKSDVKIDKFGHNYVWIEFEDNGTYYHAQECTRCFTIKNIGTHSGGTATCKDKAVCSTCGFSYGELDPDNHTHTEVRNAVDATIKKTGYSGDTWCTDCNTMIEKGTEIPKLCKHTDPSSGVVVHHEAVDATCTECENHHAGNTEYWECKVCGKLYSDEALTTETTLEEVTIAEKTHKTSIIVTEIPDPTLYQQNYDELAHWYECKYCGYVIESTYKTHTLLSSTATCCTGSKNCVLCDYDTGDYDKNNHVGATEVRNACEPDGANPGYTGDTYCLGCGECLKKGNYYFDPCEGGCKNLVYVAAVDATCTEDGMQEHYKCKDCLNLYKDSAGKYACTEEDLVIKGGHDLHPGIENLSSVSLSTLKSMIGSTNYTDIVTKLISGGETLSIDNIIKNISIKDIDHCHDDECHWLGCQRCGKTLADLKSELQMAGINISESWYELSAKEAHSGGTATCQSPAICTECGETYGAKLAKHNCSEDNICSMCKQAIDCCDAPDVTISRASDTGKISLSWDEVADAEYYKVWRCTSKDGKYVQVGKTTTTSFVDNSAIEGTTYYYKVQAMGTNGSYGIESDVVSRACTCARPVITITNSTSSGKAIIKWESIDGASSYYVYRSTKEDSGFSYIGKSSGLSYTDSSATAGKTYYYKVKAISTSGSSYNSALSAPVSRLIKLARPVVTVTNVAATGKIQLKWSAISGADKYYIYRSTDGDSFEYIGASTSTSVINAGAKAGKLYYYKVVAVCNANSDANSAKSAAVKISCDCARPTVTIKLSNGDPKLSWKAVDGADKYYIYRSTDGGKTYSKYATTSKLTYTNTKVTSGKTYYYKVKAVCSSNSGATSAYSTAVSAKAK